MKTHYDYIIAGAGLAGLSLAYRMLEAGVLEGKSMLIIEPDAKDSNDHTWCHWSKLADVFDPILEKTWSNILVAGEGKLIEKNILPYQYKMIRSERFYAFTKKAIHGAVNIDWLQQKVVGIEANKNEITVLTDNAKFLCKQVFKNYIDQELASTKDHFVWQHFKGFFIETEADYFDENKIHFMDFRTPQNNQTRFFYVLPTSKRAALIEIAIFSNEILSSDAYDKLIKQFIAQHLDDVKYTIKEEELAKIPMTTFDFSRNTNKNIINIGGAAGNIKPSSGYAYQRIQAHTKAIVACLQKHQHPAKAEEMFKSRFKKYDKIFLNVLLSGKASGEKVFMDMFTKLSPQQIFRFLDEETSFLQELSIFTAPPTLPFLKAFIEEI